MPSILPKKLALAAWVILLGNQPLSAQEEPSLRIGHPDEKKLPATPPDRAFVYDPLADLRHSGEGDDLSLDSPYYTADSVKAALAHLPPDLQLGPQDIPDYAEQDREERLGEYVAALARMPRHRATIFGMPCDLTSPLSFTCHVPGTDCIVGVGFPPVFLCPF